MSETSTTTLASDVHTIGPATPAPVAPAAPIAPVAPAPEWQNTSPSESQRLAINQKILAMVAQYVTEVNKIFPTAKVEPTVSGSAGQLNYTVSMKISHVPNAEECVALGMVYNPTRTTPHTICSCGMNFFPGNCGMMVIHGLTTGPSYALKGMGTLMVKMMEKIALDSNYTILMATTNQANIYGVKILQKLKYLNLLNFTNMRTSNPIITWVKNIR